MAQFTYGTSSSQVQKLYYNEATITAGSNSDLDLTALTGSNGATVDGTGLKVQAIMVKAVSGNGAVLTIGGE